MVACAKNTLCSCARIVRKQGEGQAQACGQALRFLESGMNHGDYTGVVFQYRGLDGC